VSDSLSALSKSLRLRFLTTLFDTVAACNLGIVSDSEEETLVGLWVPTNGNDDATLEIITFITLRQFT